MSDAAVERLKALLFDRETATLETLARRIDAVEQEDKTGALALSRRIDELFDKAGTPERLRQSVAGVIDGVLRDAEVARHDDLANAVAPVVVGTIKTELKNSQNDLVDLLYPMTGRMVKAYVASALKDLADQINRSLESGIRQNRLSLWVRSVTSGRSMAEIALADTQRPELSGLYLIRRGTGELVQRWPAAPGRAEDDEDMSNVLAAINEFAGHALKAEGGAIRSFELDTSTIFLRASPTYLLAAKCTGVARRGLAKAIDTALLNVVEARRELSDGAHLGANGATPALPATPPKALLEEASKSLSDEIEARRKELERQRGPSPLKIAAILVLLPLAAALAWYGYGVYQHDSVAARAEKVVSGSSEVAGYPVRIDVAPRGESLTLKGLVATAGIAAAMVERLRGALPSVKVTSELTALPEQMDARPSIDRVKGEVAALRTDVERAGVERALTRATVRLAPLSEQLERLAAGTNSEATRNRLVSARQHVATAAAGVAEAHRHLTEAAAGADVTTGPIAKATRELDLANGLMSVAGEPAQAPEASNSPRIDPLESAERLTLAAEHIASRVETAIALSKIPAPSPQREPTALETLSAYVRTHAVFFGDDVDYRSAQEAEQTIGEVSRLATAAGALIRVAGYTDERGSQQRNGSLAKARADKVAAALIARGLPGDKVVAIGRAQGYDISPVTGTASPNRRVEFEIGFAGEAGLGASP